MTKFIQKFDFSSIIEILSDQILQRIEIKHGPKAIVQSRRVFGSKNWYYFLNKMGQVLSAATARRINGSGNGGNGVGSEGSRNKQESPYR